MAASIECCIHIFSDESGPILPISEKTLQTIKDSAEKWRQLDSAEREIGVKAHLSDVQPEPLCTAGFQMPCYRRFTDKTKIARSVKRCAKIGQPAMPVLLMCIPQGKVGVMLSVLAVARKVTIQREETLMCFQRSASYVKERNILRIHIPRRNNGKSTQFANHTLGELEVN